MQEKSKGNFLWLLKMAWRDSRRNRGKLFLFMSSIVLGMTALVAINSFGDNLEEKIVSESKALLGADLEVESLYPISDELIAYFDSLGMQQSHEVSFASMVLFPHNGGTRLVNVRAVDENFPFYGEIGTIPPGANSALHQSMSALADQTLMLQFDASVDDTVKVGELNFQIAGSVVKVPGQAGIAATVAPPVFIPVEYLEETGLLKKGSRINYHLYLKYPADFDPELFQEHIEPRLEQELDIRYDDVQERQEEVGEAYSDLTGFLNLTAFLALLLGGIGVGSSVHVYMKEKTQTVAVMRCLGVTGSQAVQIFLLQVLMMALLGSILGAALGSAVQFYLPQLFTGFLPFEVDLSLSWWSIAEGIATGVVTAMLFALLPLLNIRDISPLQALRASVNTKGMGRTAYVIYAAILLFVFCFAWLQMGELDAAFYFTLGLLISLLILTALGKLVIWMVRKFFPSRAPFILRQSLANLYRPNNQTLVLVVTIGLGTALIATLLLSQELLLDKVKFDAGKADQPNMVLFDIQTGQLDSVKDLMNKMEMPLISHTPVVNMRLHSINGRGVAELQNDTTDKIRNWTVRRSYRVTYRDKLKPSEEILSGRWQERVEPGDSILLSLEEDIAEDMDVQVGDPVVFNVQGAIVTTYVGNIRKIDWQRVEANFLVVFPAGVLEDAPQFHVLMSRVKNPAHSAEFQKAAVQAFPNISVIDLDTILKTIDTVIGKISFVIRFMAFFSIVTGLLVLIGSVIISKYQRIQESVLLRTLGAVRKQILGINALEYFLLGSLAAITGILLGLLSGWLLAYFNFEGVFSPDPLPLIIIYFCISLLTVIIGLINSRDVVNRPPLEILRKEY